MTKYGMVIDLDRCTGCQTCVVTCQMHHNTKPDVAWSHVDTVEVGRWPDGDRFALPHACMHCDNAPCVTVCPSGATTQREDGIVTVDYETCIACGSCTMVCPYDARTLVFGDEHFFGASEAAPYELYGTQRTDVVEKCIFCNDRVDEGLPPHCVNECPQKARIFGDLDDPQSEISAYIKDYAAEQLDGTSIYYVKGNRDINLRETLATSISEIPDTEAMKEAVADEPVAESAQPGINAAAAIGGGVVAVAAAAGIGFAAGNSHGKKSNANATGKDGE